MYIFRPKIHIQSIFVPFPVANVLLKGSACVEAIPLSEGVRVYMAYGGYWVCLW